MVYLCNMENDEVKNIKTLDYGKVLITNFFFVRQYLILLIHRDDNYFDMYSLRKNEVELIKSFNKVFNTINFMFKSTSKGFFSNLFVNKMDKQAKQIQIVQNYNNAYYNFYKNSQFFLEFIYSNIFFILLSYEDNAIFMMKIKNINKFPKEEEGNRVIRLEYKNHSNNSTIQFMDNLLFVHNFTNDTTVIYDIALKAKEKIICLSRNILKDFHSENFFKLNIIGGNIEETCKIKKENGEQEVEKKLYSLNLNLENLFKNNENKKKKNLKNEEVELDGMLMISRRNKSKIFFLELFEKMLLDKTTKHRTDKIQLILKEFSRQIQKINSLALDLMSNVSLVNESLNSAKTVKLSYKRENEKFYLDDKYIMLSTKNTLSQIEVIKSFKSVGQLSQEKKLIMNDDSIFEYLLYILFFYIQLVQHHIEIIKLYYDTILLLIQQIKDEKKIIKLITYYSYEKIFPLGSIDVAKYLLDNYSHPIIKIEAYKILKLLKAHNELFYYLLKNEGLEYAIEFLQNSFEENNFNDVKKFLVNYLNNEKETEIIFKELNEIKKELKDEKLKKDNLKKTIDELIKENNTLKAQVKEILDWKNSQLKKKDDNKDNNDIKQRIDSKIIKTKEEIKLLSNRLTSKGFIKNCKVSFNLLYRASRDGDSPKDYHNKCDGKTNTLCVIQTRKGCQFGGYTEVTIDSSGSDYKDPNAFVFSLNKNKIYENLRKEDSAVCHNKNWGPIFRNDAFAVWDKNFFSYSKHRLGRKSQLLFGVMNEDYEINNGEEYFGIRELEVFQIIIE
mgnify:CR=1 FL=1